MPRLRPPAAAIVCVVLAALAAGRASSAGSVPVVSYTVSQAAAGAKQYAAHCASCHGTALQGVNGPPLAGTAIRGTQSVADIYGFVTTQMPLGAAGSLSAANYAAIMAFLLQKNGHPAGPVALTPAKAASITATF